MLFSRIGGLVRYSVSLQSIIFWSLQEVMCQRAMKPPRQITFLTCISVPWWRQRVWYTPKMIIGLCSEACVMKHPFSNIIIGSVVGKSCFGWGWKHQNIVFPSEPCPPCVWCICYDWCSGLHWPWQFESKQQLCSATANPVVDLVSKSCVSSWFIIQITR